jgi:hypothetical protein
MINIGIGNWIGRSGGSYWTQQRILDTFGEKIVLWTSKNDETDNYYINKIGEQIREDVSEDGTAGVTHKGRAIQYDGVKSQQSAMIHNTPANFRLVNNNISYSLWFKTSAFPAANGFLFGSAPTATSGAYYTIINSSGQLTIMLRASSAQNESVAFQCILNKWHHIAVSIDRSGNYVVYVDNVEKLSVSISALSFGDFVLPLFIGGTSSYFSGTHQIRDVRLFSKAISVAEIKSLYYGDYVDGTVSWWPMEGGNESNENVLLNTVNPLYPMVNTGFDATSLISDGAWDSLMNKFGYSQKEYLSDNIIPEGDFTDPDKWSFTATRFQVTGGVAHYKAVDALAPALTQVTLYAAPFKLGYYEVTFNIVEGATPTFALKLADTTVANTTYSPGVNTIYVFVSAPGLRNVVITGDYNGGAFKMDDLTIKYYSRGLIPAIGTGALPTTDIFSRALTFIGQAKYNLLKIAGGKVQLPDRIGETVRADESILNQAWYDASGDGEEILLTDINPYETGRQYYKDEELILIKAGAIITEAEDVILKKKLKLDNYPTQIIIDVAKGSIEGTTTEIYASVQALHDSESFTVQKSFAVTTPTLSPENKYIALGWADFFTTDKAENLPHITKYNSLGFGVTFYRQIKPTTANPLLSIYDREALKNIEKVGSRDGQHGLILHIAFLSAQPLCDGRLHPPNDDMRLDRGDGKNEFGHDITDTFDNTVGSVIRASWLRLSAELGAKAWEDLTDADCIAIRKSLGAFGMPIDGQNQQKVLESIDILSARYCGTTGTSVYNDDYATRTPNTADGFEPSESNKIIGGIFQGATTTQNHEIWERLLVISKQTKIEFEGLTKDDIFHSSVGGNPDTLSYESAGIKYLDKAHGKLPYGHSLFSSSITGEIRSYMDALREAGYKTGFFTQGDGYIYPIEAGRQMKKNGLKRLDCLGDTFWSKLRPWDSTIPLAAQQALLLEEDVVKSLYDYTLTNIADYPADSEFTSPAAFYPVLNTMTKFLAWGTTPVFVADSGTTGDGISSYILVLEALYQFCRRAGITVISHEQAYELATIKLLPAGWNYFPNPTFETTPKTVTESLNAPIYPDGWDGGEVLEEDTGGGNTNVLHIASDGTIYTRNYSIKPPMNLSLTFKAKGIGTLIVRKIINKDAYNATYAVINTIAINSPDSYIEYSDTVILPDEAMEVYGEPDDLNDGLYQNYMKGYGDKICGIQIELIIAEGNYVKIGNCSLIE